MTINLNSSEFEQKLPITKDNVLALADEYSIFVYYLGQELTIGSVITNPFRENDTKPSLGVFKTTKTNLMYKDLGSGNSGDCFVFIAVEVYKNSITYKEALEQVILDFNLEEKFIPISRKKQYKKQTPKIFKEFKERSKYPLRIKSRKFYKYDYDYWASFLIYPQQLRKYRVIPVEYYSFGPHIFKADKYAYAYIENKDNEITYKIYQPFSPSNIGKFLSGMNQSIHTGYEQLPLTGDCLIITKSVKDVMTIDSVLSYPTIGIMSESVLLKDSVAEEYKERFRTVFTLFDNDEPGMALGKEYEAKYNFAHCYVPETSGVKDISDFAKFYGKEKTEKLLGTLTVSAIFREQDYNLPF